MASESALVCTEFYRALLATEEQEDEARCDMIFYGRRFWNQTAHAVRDRLQQLYYEKETSPPLIPEADPSNAAYFARDIAVTQHMADETEQHLDRVRAVVAGLDCRRALDYGRMMESGQEDQLVEHLATRVQFWKEQAIHVIRLKMVLLMIYEFETNYLARPGPDFSYPVFGEENQKRRRTLIDLVGGPVTPLEKARVLKQGGSLDAAHAQAMYDLCQQLEFMQYPPLETFAVHEPEWMVLQDYRETLLGNLPVLAVDLDLAALASWFEGVDYSSFGDLDECCLDYQEASIRRVTKKREPRERLAGQLDCA